MKLSFLGKSYEATSPEMDATVTGETRTFLGNAYAQKRFNIAQRQQITEELTFLGRRYTR